MRAGYTEAGYDLAGMAGLTPRRCWAGPCLWRRQPVRRPPKQMDLRTYGVGAQILRHIGVRRMKLLGNPRRMPSMTGYGLEVTGFVAAPQKS